MSLKKNVAVSADGFVFDSSNGLSYTANPCGVEIIEMLRQNADAFQIKRHITSKYEVDDVTAEKDIMDFIEILSLYKIIDK